MPSLAQDTVSHKPFHILQ